MQVQRPELDVHVEAERSRARFGDRRRVETEKDRRDRDGERAVRPCGQPNGDQRREGEKRRGEDVRETLTKSHETQQGQSRARSKHCSLGNLPKKMAGRKRPAIGLFDCGTKASRLRAIREHWSAKASAERSRQARLLAVPPWFFSLRLARRY